MPDRSLQPPGQLTPPPSHGQTLVCPGGHGLPGAEGNDQTLGLAQCFTTQREGELCSFRGPGTAWLAPLWPAWLLRGVWPVWVGSPRPRPACTEGWAPPAPPTLTRPLFFSSLPPATCRARVTTRTRVPVTVTQIKCKCHGEPATLHLTTHLCVLDSHLPRRVCPHL